jgi:hypothetical protein
LSGVSNAALVSEKISKIVENMKANFTEANKFISQVEE